MRCDVRRVHARPGQNDSKHDIVAVVSVDVDVDDDICDDRWLSTSSNSLA